MRAVKQEARARASRGQPDKLNGSALVRPTATRPWKTTLHHRGLTHSRPMTRNAPVTPGSEHPVKRAPRHSVQRLVRQSKVHQSKKLPSDTFRLRAGNRAGHRVLTNSSLRLCIFASLCVSALKSTPLKGKGAKTPSRKASIRLEITTEQLVTCSRRNKVWSRCG